MLFRDIWSIFAISSVVFSSYKIEINYDARNELFQVLTDFSVVEGKRNDSITEKFLR